VKDVSAERGSGHLFTQVAELRAEPSSAPLTWAVSKAPFNDLAGLGAILIFAATDRASPLPDWNRRPVMHG
jgi:hypothetical protein